MTFDHRYFPLPSIFLMRKNAAGRSSSPNPENTIKTLSNQSRSVISRHPVIFGKTFSKNAKNLKLSHTMSTTHTTYGMSVLSPFPSSPENFPSSAGLSSQIISTLSFSCLSNLQTCFSWGWRIKTLVGAKVRTASPPPILYLINVCPILVLQLFVHYHVLLLARI